MHGPTESGGGTRGQRSARSASLGRLAVGCAAAIAALFAASIVAIGQLTRPQPGAAGPEEEVPVVEVPPATPAPVPTGARDGARSGALAPPAPLPVGASATPVAPERASVRVISPVAAAAIRISFQMDPRLTQGLHMGERWVSPPRYTRTLDATGTGLHARARVLDGHGRPVDAAPAWTSAQPELVGVWPPLGSTVEIVPRREGRTAVKVSAGGASTELTVTAARQGGGWRVDVSQPGPR